MTNSTVTVSSKDKYGMVKPGTTMTGALRKYLKKYSYGVSILNKIIFH